MVCNFGDPIVSARNPTASKHAKVPRTVSLKISVDSNFPDKDTMITWVSTPHDCLRFRIYVLSMCAAICASLIPYQTYVCIKKHSIPLFCQLCSVAWERIWLHGPRDLFFRHRSCRNSTYKWTLTQANWRRKIKELLVKSHHTCRPYTKLPGNLGAVDHSFHTLTA